MKTKARSILVLSLFKSSALDIKNSDELTNQDFSMLCFQALRVSSEHEITKEWRETKMNDEQSNAMHNIVSTMKQGWNCKRRSAYEELLALAEVED